MTNILEEFKYVPQSTVTLAEALSTFIKEGITFGRIKGGEKIPTIQKISETTGLSFGMARRMVERLAREGYVYSRPHTGTIVLPREGNILRGRILFALPDVDACRYHADQVMDVLRHKLSAANYALSVCTFSLDESADLSYLKSELLRAPDMVIAARATPKVQKCLAESGISHFFVYGDKPLDEKRPWVRFFDETALSHFAEHCEKAGVKHVVQVRFEENETRDAQHALEEKGISCSWMTISRGEEGRRRFDGVVQCAYDTFAAMPRERIPDLLLFWNSFLTQGAVTAFLARGIRLPEDVKVVTLSNTGVGPVYTVPFTRFEVDPVDAGKKIADFAIAILLKGRIPRVPQVIPQYIFGSTFPF